MDMSPGKQRYCYLAILHTIVNFSSLFLSHKGHTYLLSHPGIWHARQVIVTVPAVRLQLTVAPGDSATKRSGRRICPFAISGMTLVSVSMGIVKLLTTAVALPGVSLIEPRPPVTFTECAAASQAAAAPMTPVMTCGRYRHSAARAHERRITLCLHGASDAPRQRWFTSCRLSGRQASRIVFPVGYCRVEIVSLPD